MAETKELRVFLHQEGAVPQITSLQVPVGCGFHDLLNTISDQVLGPEEERWSKFKEDRVENLNPEDGGGTIDITSHFEAQQLHLWTHPHDDCCPVTSIELQEVPPNVDLYGLMLGEYQMAPIDSDEELHNWWASLPRGRGVLHAMAVQRLVSKATVHPEFGEIRTRLLLEGVQGLWEMSCEKKFAQRLGREALEQLVDALRCGLPHVMEVAAAASWNLVAVADVRTALVQLGLVEALVSAASDASAWRASGQVDLQACNRIVYHVLGALGILSVDGTARAKCLQISSTLQFLLDLAFQDFPAPSPPAPVHAAPVTEVPAAAEGAAEGQEGAAGEGAAGGEQHKSDDAAGADAAAAAAPGDDAAAPASGAPEGEQSGGQQAADAHADAEHHPAAPSFDEEPVEFVIPPEDDPRVHHKMAAEVLYTMLGRDRIVRGAFATANGLPSLVQLLEHPTSGDARFCAAAAFAAYGRDVVTASSAANAAGGLEGESSEEQQGHVGVGMLMRCGMTFSMIEHLENAIELCIEQIRSGETVVGVDDHSLANMMENLCVALLATVMAQILNEADSVNASAARTLNFRGVSRLARIAGMLVVLLNKVHEAPEAAPHPSLNAHRSAVSRQQSAERTSDRASNTGTPSAGSKQGSLRVRGSTDGAHARGSNDGGRQHGHQQLSGLPAGVAAAAAAAVSAADAEAAAAEQKQQAVGSLASAIFSVMAAVAAIHQSPVLLTRAHNDLVRMHIDLQQLRSETDSAHNQLEEHSKSMQAKRSSSRFYFDDEEDDETEKLNEKIVQLERDIEELDNQIQELEEALQAGCEESVAAAQDALMLEPIHPRVAHVQLMAAGVVMAMAQAAHPALTPTVEDTAPVFMGPYRALLHETNVLLDVMRVISNLSNVESNILVHNTRLVVASAVAYLMAIEEPLAPDVLKAVTGYMKASTEHPSTIPFLAAAMWCLCRHEQNRQQLLSTDVWIELIQNWMSKGLATIRRSLALTTGPGFNPAAGFPGAPLDPNQQQQPPQTGFRTVRQVRFSMMALWMLMRQWLMENMSPMNTLTEADGLYARSTTSWWSLRFSMDTPLAVTSAMESAAQLMVEAAALPDAAGSRAAELRELATKCCWNLSTAHPAIAAKLVSLGTAQLMMGVCSSPTAGSSLLQVSLAYALFLTTTPEHVTAMGGLGQICKVLVGLIDRALSSSLDKSGAGADVQLLEVAVRALARMALSVEGRHAVRAAKGVKRLVAVLRADNMALEAVASHRHARGVPDWLHVEQLFSPLRAVNDLPITLAGEQKTAAAEFETVAKHAAAAAAAAAAGPVPPNSVRARSPETGEENKDDAAGDDKEPRQDDAVCGDADVGLMAVWGLLNMSGYDPAQVSICKHGLYTLLRAVHRSSDPLRARAAAAILSNIHYHPENATTLYKAELKLKYAALMQLQGGPSLERVRLSKLPPGVGPSKFGKVSKGPQFIGKGTLQMANQEMSSSMAQLQNLQTTESEEADGSKSSMEAKISFLKWVVDPGAHALNYMDDQGAGKTPQQVAADVASMTQGDLLTQLTCDPEELIYLRFLQSADKLEDFYDVRYDQGTFLRGMLVRSLAEGPQSLWNARKEKEERAAAAAAASTGAEGQRSPSVGAGAATARPGSAANSRPRSTTPAGDMHRPPSPQVKGQGQGLPRSPSARVGSPSQKMLAGAEASSPATGKRAPSPMGLNSPSLRAQSPAAPSPKAGGSANRRPPPSPSSGAEKWSSSRNGAKGQQQRPLTAQPSSNSRSSQQSRPSTAQPVHQRIYGARQKQGKNQVDYSVLDRPGSAAWAPQIVQYTQDPGFTKPQVYLAQRLLMASAPKAVQDHLSGLAGKVFENQVLKEGIKAVQKKQEEEAEARAQQEAEEEEVRRKMEEEARVVDLVRFESMESFLAPPQHLSRAVSRAVVRGLSRAASRAASRAVSRVMSRVGSRPASRTESFEPSGGNSGHVTPPAMITPPITARNSGDPKKPMPPSAMSMKRRLSPIKSVRMAGDVMFKGADEGNAGDSGPLTARSGAASLHEAPMNPPVLSAANSAISADAVAAALARSSHSFVATSLVQIGALSSFPAGRNAHSRASHSGDRPSSAAGPAGARRAQSARGPSASAGAAHAHANSSHPHSHPHPHHPPAASGLSSRAGGDHSGQYLTASFDPPDQDALAHFLPPGSIDGSDDAGAETQWLGADVSAALRKPDTTYRRPHLGQVSPHGVSMASMKSDKQLALEALLHPERVKSRGEPRIAEDVPRPVTVLAASVDDVLALKGQREQDGNMRGADGFGGSGGAGASSAAASAGPLDGPMPLSMTVATGDGGPDQVYRFPRDLTYDPRHIVMFEHVEGCRFCRDLYGHYLLPSGKLAHFHIGDTVRKGHKIDLLPPPAIPFSAQDWLAEGLPRTDALGEYDLSPPGARPASTSAAPTASRQQHMVAAGSELFTPLWCPVPQLGPQPEVWTLQWDDTHSGLVLRSVNMAATLERITKTSAEQIVVEPKPKPKPKKKKPGSGRPGSPSRLSPPSSPVARGGPSSPTKAGGKATPASPAGRAR